MRAVFADTAYYVAVLNERDSLYPNAKTYAAQPDWTYVTTEYVLVEVANFYSRSGRRGHFVTLDARLRTAQNTVIIAANSELYRAGLALFAARPDKEWSLTDCTSFAVMTDRKMTDALTADAHFTQAGFKALLLDESS
jgi:predicted nucleic acid-binding protein